MYKAKIRLVLFNFAFIVLASDPVCAQGHGAPASEVSTTKQGEFSGHQNEKWADIQKSLLELKVKVDSQKVVVADLLRAKKDNDGKISQAEIATLKSEHERLQKLTKDYNEILADFQFRFPEKGLESGRKYIRLENQTLEDMENSPTLQGRLKKLSRKIKKQFQVEENVPDNSKVEKSTHKTEKTAEKQMQKKQSSDPQVTDQIILVK